MQTHTRMAVRISIALFLAASVALSAGRAPATNRDGAFDRPPWRSIGPANMSGRVTDVAVPKGRSTTIYCATASGGVWKTVNNGTTWTPIFDRYGSSSIGAVAVADSESRRRVGRHRRGEREQLYLMG